MLLQSFFDTWTQWTPANVSVHHCSTEPFILLCDGVHQSAGHKRQCAKACERLPAIYLWGNTGGRCMYNMMLWCSWFTTNSLTMTISINMNSMNCIVLKKFFYSALVLGLTMTILLYSRLSYYIHNIISCWKWFWVWYFWEKACRCIWLLWLSRRSFVCMRLTVA